KAEYDAYGIADSGEPLDPSIGTLRKMYKDTGWDKMNTGAKQFYVDHVSDRYTKRGDLYINPKGEEVIAYTRRNFWDNNTSSISFSRHAFGSKIKLGFVMAHELGHSMLNLYPAFNALRFDKTIKGYENAIIPGAGGISVDHAAIWGLENDFITKNGLKDVGLPGFFKNTSQMQGIFNSYILKNVTYKQLYEKIKILSVKIK
ncbi:hypothetical protein, partial [Chryseobacterium gossypii]|uniref:hypothetical protein n=1 Tax=Chryseobacterium gossypii TaxID=3231602 RepID=UPI003523875E